MKVSILATIFLTATITCFSQTDEYLVGILSTQGAISKFDMQIFVSDSVVVLKAPGHAADEKKVTNKKGEVLYVTDGTAVDKITIVPVIGKLKGFNYDHQISYQQDSKFNGSTIIYWCRKKI